MRVDASITSSLQTGYESAMNEVESGRVRPDAIFCDRLDQRKEKISTVLNFSFIQS